MRGDIGVRVLAEQPRLDLDAGKRVAMNGEPRDLLVGKARTERQALEIPRFLHQLAESLAIAVADIDDLRERVDRLVQILDPRRRDFQRVTGVALGKHNAVAIGDHAAIRHDRNDRDPVGLGERLKMLVLYDLQVKETREETGEREQHESTGEPQPATEKETIAFRVAEIGARAGTEAALARDEKRPSLHDRSLQPFADECVGRCGYCSSTEMSGHNSAPTTGGAA